MQPALNTRTPLANALQALDPTGMGGFEGLVAGILSELTSVPFRPARSGPQRGRDLDSDPTEPWFAVVECKRYRDDTKLDQRALTSEIMVATSEDPQIDLWILATSRDVDANVARWLQETSRDRGVDHMILQCGSADNFGDLDVLCAHSQELVVQHCSAVLPEGISELGAYLEAIRAHANFSARLQRVRSRLDGGTVGLHTFRDRINEKLIQAMRSESASVGRFNRRLDVGGVGEVRDVARLNVRAGLDAFMGVASQPTSSPLCVVHGEEGNGKSWAVASWVQDRIGRENAPAVFWFSAGSCTDASPIRQLADYATEALSCGREINFFAKFQRWISRVSTRQQLLVVLDGINERHEITFWANHLFRSVADYQGHVSIVVTCRTQTWRDELEERLRPRPHLIEVSPFDDNEFAQALIGRNFADVDRLWRVGSLVRKPRYLATALQVVRELQTGEDLTVERLFYEAMKARVRTRTDYPLGGKNFEALLRDLAQQANESIRPHDVAAGLPLTEGREDILRELASGGVLRQNQIGGYYIDQSYLVVGMALLLVEELRRSPGSTDHLRQQVGSWLNDTHRFPLTAKICADASYRALQDPSVPRAASTALVLEFIACTNPDAGLLNSVIMHAARNVDVLCDVCERIWAQRGVDYAVEREILKALIAAANDRDRRGALCVRLAQWAGFVHEFGEYEQDLGATDAPKVDARVIALISSVGQAIDVGSGISLKRLESQRLLRLGRLALAVVSFCDRRFFYPVLLTTLAADAVMASSRSSVVHWIVASSRQPLDDFIKHTLGRLTGLSPADAGRVERCLLSALAAPSLANQLHALNAQSPSMQMEERYARIFRTPTDQELPEYLSDTEVPSHWRLEKAKRAASDPGMNFPPDFVQQVQAAVSSFNVGLRRKGIWTAEADYSWESYESILCRVDPDLLLAKLLEFVNDVSERTGERLYAWALSADSLAGLLGSREIAAIRRALIALSNRGIDGNKHDEISEAMLLCMLLSHATPHEQLDMLIARPENARFLTRASARFATLRSCDEQRSIAARIDESSHAFTAVLWLVSEQSGLDDSVWIEPVRRGLASASTVERGLALKIASGLSTQVQAQFVDLVDVRRPEACALEKFYGTQLLLDHAEELAVSVLARCELSACCHLVGRQSTRRRSEILRAFAGLVVDWLCKRVRPASSAPTAPAITVGDPETSDPPWVNVSVDWANQDNTVSFRSEMSTWGGLPPGGPGEFARKLGGTDEISGELQAALQLAVQEAQQEGDWGFASFWSSDTLVGLVESDPNFLPYVLSGFKEAVARQTLNAVLPFATALCRSLLPSRLGDALEILTLIDEKRNLVTDVDGWSGEKLFDLALCSAPTSDETCMRWMRRLDDSRNDAQLLLCGEQLVAGGNRHWLQEVALREVQGEATFFRRRGILLLAAATPDDHFFESVIERSVAEVCGLDDVVACARRYRDIRRRMVHWIDLGMKAQSALSAYSAFRLLASCADRRVWRLLSQARKEAENLGHTPVFFRIFALDDLRNAVRRHESNDQKTFLGINVREHDAAPWIDL